MISSTLPLFKRQFKTHINHRAVILRENSIVTLTRHLNDQLWNNREYIRFNGVVGFLPNKELEDMLKPEFCLGKNCVQFTQVDIHSEGSNGALLKGIRMIGRKVGSILNFDPIAHVECPNGNTERYPFINPMKIPDIDPCSRIRLLVNDISFSENIIDLPTFSGDLSVGDDFLSEELKLKIGEYFSERIEQYLELYPLAVRQCNDILEGDKADFKAILRPEDDKEFANAMLRDLKTLKEKFETSVFLDRNFPI